MRRGNRKLRKSKEIALSVLFAGLYPVLVYTFHPISFLQIQCRIADIMYALLPFSRWTGVIGLTLGCIIANITSPLGYLDLLTPIWELPFKILIVYMSRRWKLKGYIVSSLLCSLWVSIYVAFLLWKVLNLPFLVSLVLVFAGCAISITLFGSILFKALLKIPSFRALIE